MLNNNKTLTFCIFHKDLNGMRAAVFRSISRPYPDRDSHANPYVTCNLPLPPIQEKMLLIN